VRQFDICSHFDIDWVVVTLFRGASVLPERAGISIFALRENQIRRAHCFLQSPLVVVGVFYFKTSTENTATSIATFSIRSAPRLRNMWLGEGNLA
jgi:hypothetical protein